LQDREPILVDVVEQSENLLPFAYCAGTARLFERNDRAI